MRTLFGAWMAVVLVTGCAAPEGARPSPTPVAVQSPTAPPAEPTGTPYAPPPAAGDATMARSDVARAGADTQAGRRAARAVEAFALDLYRELAQEEEDGNLLVSPYSIAIALAMTRAGAVGGTADEMDAVLHAALAGDLHAGFNALEQELAKRPGTYPYGYQNTVDLELGTANQLWAQRGYPFERPFLDTLAAHYGAGMRLVDYVHARQQAREEINRWVAERTRERIPELLAEDALNDLTRFVLTNAIYLKAKWVSPFSKERTAAAPFYRLDGSEVQAQLMHGDGYRWYSSAPGYQAVRLGYVGGLSMTVIVPDAGTFEAFESRLRDPAELRQLTDALAAEYVILRMPRFEFRSTSKLKPALEALGMPTAFTVDADFSPMSAYGRDLLIQEVVHEAFISVDEEGTEAAAATAVIGGATGGPSRVLELTVDRPFLFLIEDDETGAILFMGRVLDPT